MRANVTPPIALAREETRVRAIHLSVAEKWPRLQVAMAVDGDEALVQIADHLAAYRIAVPPVGPIHFGHVLVDLRDGVVVLAADEKKLPIVRHVSVERLKLLAECGPEDAIIFHDEHGVVLREKALLQHASMAEHTPPSSVAGCPTIWHGEFPSIHGRVPLGTLERPVTRIDALIEAVKPLVPPLHVEHTHGVK